MTVFVVQVGIGPSMCCYRCKHMFKEGDETFIYQKPIYFRWPKQRKKAKANTHNGLRIHLRCA